MGSHKNRVKKVATQKLKKRSQIIDTEEFGVTGIRTPRSEHNYNQKYESLQRIEEDPHM